MARRMACVSRIPLPLVARGASALDAPARAERGAFPPSRARGRLRPWSRQLAALALLGVVSGCATSRISPEPTFAWAHPAETPIGRRVEERLAGAPGQSGFHLIEYGREALLARGALADAAEHTIDCQYYIYDPDRSGAFMTNRLLAAADRGVRVRLLLDDFNLASDVDAANLDAHPHVEVRIFNPIQTRIRWLRLPEYLFRFNRLVRRMHNKIFAVDGAVALLGGRNIGDNYFDLDERGNFRDFDLICAGPVAEDANHIFDLFWNSPMAVPMSSLARTRSTRDLAALRTRIDGFLNRQPGYPKEYLSAAAAWIQRLPNAMIIARGEVIWEPPEKIEQATVETAQVVVRLAQELAAVTNSVLIESGYFIPRRTGADGLGRMSAKGVRVAIVTAALQATDEPLVFSAYQRYRKGMLLDGIELYEYRRDADATSSQRAWKRANSSASAIHSKVLLLDNRKSWIGSFNLDPRSAALNTEIAILVEGPDMAARLRRYLEEAKDPARSFSVRLEDGRLTWVGEEEGRIRRWTRDPGATGWQRVRAFIYGMIPGIERQL